MKDHYETNSVAKGKASYSCDCCGKSIKKGGTSDVHKFYPYFDDYRTHTKCSNKFLKGEMCCECGEWNPSKTCKTCVAEAKKEALAELKKSKKK